MRRHDEEEQCVLGGWPEQEKVYKAPEPSPVSSYAQLLSCADFLLAPLNSAWPFLANTKWKVRKTTMSLWSALVCLHNIFLFLSLDSIAWLENSFKCKQSLFCQFQERKPENGKDVTFNWNLHARERVCRLAKYAHTLAKSNPSIQNSINQNVGQSFFKIQNPTFTFILILFYLW